MKANIRTLLTTAAVVMSAFLLYACPAPEDNGGAGREGRQGSDASAGKAAPAVQGSLFTGTGYDKYAPLALDIPHGVDRVFLKKLGTEGQATLIESYRLGEELTGRVEFINSDEIYRAFVRGHPSRDECLVISHRQDSHEEPIYDVLWRVTPEGKAELDYRSTPGLSAGLPAQATYNTDVHYNWAGDRVVVVLNTGELCILDEATGEWRYAPAYALPGTPTGQACRPLTDGSGRDMFFMSRWYIGRGGDWCSLAVLDLDSGEWAQSHEIYAPDDLARQWVIYDIAAEDLVQGPWLVRGSRAPNKNTEHTRVPRLAWLDPATGHVDLLMFHGDPLWPVALDPSGGGMVYLDRQRQGVVRLGLAEQRLDVDPSWYTDNDEATVYAGPGADKVYIWSRTRLYRPEFTETEEIEE